MASTKTTTPWWLILLVPLFLGLAVFFLYQTFTISPPAAVTQRLKPEWYTLSTSRGEIREHNSIVGNCFICHAFWVPIPTSMQNSDPRFAHSHITLSHGSNDRCYNCHDVTDRNKYVANDGSGIMPQIPEQLCKRCHGLIFNDWLKGTHGKWTGMSSPRRLGDQQTYTCVECHDPHDPKFKYTIIAPPPVWSEKFIRTETKGTHSGSRAGFLIGEEPKEIF